MTIMDDLREPVEEDDEKKDDEKKSDEKKKDDQLTDSRKAEKELEEKERDRRSRVIATKAAEDVLAKSKQKGKPDGTPKTKKGDGSDSDVSDGDAGKSDSDD